MARSRFIVDLAAIRHNAARLTGVLGGAELWAVVKADGYGHGAVDAGRAAVEAGARALCVATLGEATELREALPTARILVMGPSSPDEVRLAREARLELAAVAPGPLPEGIPLHVKLDTGMGRWGLSELPSPTRDVVALMSHFASSEADRTFTELQLTRFLEATSGHEGLTRHIANSAAALAVPDARLDAVRCGIALYGISPFGDGPHAWGLRPALSWTSELAAVKPLQLGESTGYGRRFVANRPTWIGLVPVGYADGFRRDLTGTEVLVGSSRHRVVGTVSMDVLAVELSQEMETGTPVTLLGDGVTAEEHARVAGTIGYEIVCGLNTRSPRADREVQGS